MSTPTSEPNVELEDVDAEESTFESVTEEIQSQPQVEDSVSTDPSSVSDNATPVSAAKVSSKTTGSRVPFYSLLYCCQSSSLLSLNQLNLNFAKLQSLAVYP